MVVAFSCKAKVAAAMSFLRIVERDAVTFQWAFNKVVLQICFGHCFPPAASGPVHLSLSRVIVLAGVPRPAVLVFTTRTARVALLRNNASLQLRPPADIEHPRRNLTPYVYTYLKSCGCIAPPSESLRVRNVSL